MSKKVTERNFPLSVLGRTLEHLGVQNYKRRDIAIIELVANSWDAGANLVEITAPLEETYSQEASQIVIKDDGIGMTDEDVEKAYLVVGRNRRQAGQGAIANRPVMGRKGIGKLAGFGVARRMNLRTWRDDVEVNLPMDIDQLKVNDGEAKQIVIPGTVGVKSGDLTNSSGTMITLDGLKHASPIDIEALHQALARRFSRRIKGEMKILVNGEPLLEPEFDIEFRIPEAASTEVILPSGARVTYHYAFTKKPIASSQLRGFTIYVNGKTAQAPPYFFNVEGTASGQHGTKYLTGEIEADFADLGDDDESDLVSTDRQELDWEDPRLEELHAWGDELTRQALLERTRRRSVEILNIIESNDDLSSRIRKLDAPSQTQLRGFLGKVAAAEVDSDKAIQLADSLVRAYEYRHFHDLIAEIEQASDNPEAVTQLLVHLQDWKVLESRAVLEVVRGRIEIIEKFHSMIVNDAPEIAPVIDADNMHDLIASYPWLLDPEWQVLAEEKAISTQLRSWSAEDVREEDQGLRYDFLALSDERRLVVIEIKRSGHAVTLEELQRLETYKERLSVGSGKEVQMVMICSKIEVSGEIKQNWENREDGDIWLWGEVYERTSRYYSHYKAILEGDVQNRDFQNKVQEVARTREVLHRGTAYRGKERRAAGVGPQDVNREAEEQ